MPSSPKPSLLPRLNFTPKSLTSSSQVTQGDGEQELWSVHNILFLFLLPSHTIPLLQSGCPCLRRHFTNFSSVGLPMGYNSSQTALVWVFTWTAALRSRLLQCVAFQKIYSNMGSPVASVPARNLLQHGLSMDCSFLQVTSTCSCVASSMDYRRKNCVVMIFPMVWKGIFAPAPGEPSPLPCSLQSCLSPHSHLLWSSFYLILNVLPWSTYQCCRQAQLWPVWISFGAGWNRLCSTWGQLLVSSHGSHLCTLPNFAQPNTLWLGMCPPTVSAWDTCLKLSMKGTIRTIWGPAPSLPIMWVVLGLRGQR